MTWNFKYSFELKSPQVEPLCIWGGVHILTIVMRRFSVPWYGSWGISFFLQCFIVSSFYQSSWKGIILIKRFYICVILIKDLVHMTACYKLLSIQFYKAKQVHLIQRQPLWPWQHVPPTTKCSELNSDDGSSFNFNFIRYKINASSWLVCIRAFTHWILIFPQLPGHELL